MRDQLDRYKYILFENTYRKLLHDLIFLNSRTQLFWILVLHVKYNNIILSTVKYSRKLYVSQTTLTQLLLYLQ